MSVADEEMTPSKYEGGLKVKIGGGWALGTAAMLRGGEKPGGEDSNVQVVGGSGEEKNPRKSKR